MDLNNKAICDANWETWLDMKLHGPASRWLRFLIHSKLNEIPNLEKIQSVLDVGCGEGTTTSFLAELLPNAEVLGVDFSKVAIECAQSRYARRNLKFEFDENLQRLDGRYAMISAFEVLEHVDNWQELLRRISRAAERFICLSFPTGRMRAFEKRLGHYRNFQRGEVERFLDQAGFTAWSVSYAGFPFYSPLYRDLCNAAYSVSDSFTTGPYGAGRMLLARAFYALFRASTKYRFGDQFCGLFVRSELALKLGLNLAKQ